jgi:cytochrome c556
MAVALGAGAGYATMVMAQQKPEVLVKQRQAAMVLQNKYFGPLNGMASGKVPFNKDTAVRAAGYLEVLSNMAWDGFHPNTKDTTEKTRALPAIYENEAKFKEYQDSFKNGATKLHTAAKAGDEGAFKGAAKEVGQACSGCHKEFRAK